MIRVFKTLLLWLMLATLPLQGVAAVVKVACGPEHHVMIPSTFDHHHADADAGLYHGDENSHPATTHGSPDSDADAAAADKASTCSACATCCVGATAPPSALNLAPELPASNFIVPFPVVAFNGHIPASLERPPKHPLA